MACAVRIDLAVIGIDHRTASKISSIHQKMKNHIPVRGVGFHQYLALTKITAGFCGVGNAGAAE